ncbi:hypothetical protein [Streptomyces lavendulae]|uniref:hypothetical protein n=1 Tax=Streptomyces lavendulae TaxID=1914 RepID=UPI0036E3B2E4
MPWASMAPARSGAGRAAPELLTTPATELPDLPVLLTVLDGRPTHRQREAGLRRGPGPGCTIIVGETIIVRGYACHT